LKKIRFKQFEADFLFYMFWLISRSSIFQSFFLSTCQPDLSYWGNKHIGEPPEWNI
jgi:hypothetical protein